MSYVARLRAENEELIERVRQLEAILAPPSITPPAGITLTPSELRIYQSLATGRTMSREALAAVIHIGRPEDDLNPYVVDVHLVRIRKKLMPIGISIVSRWGQGWQMQSTGTESAQ